MCVTPTELKIQLAQKPLSEVNTFPPHRRLKLDTIYRVLIYY